MSMCLYWQSQCQYAMRYSHAYCVMCVAVAANDMNVRGVRNNNNTGSSLEVRRRPTAAKHEFYARARSHTPNETRKINRKKNNNNLLLLHIVQIVNECVH